MLKVGSKARLAVGLIAVWFVINVLYFAARSLYAPLAIPSTIAVATITVIYLMRRWHREPPLYDNELRKLMAMANLTPSLRGTFLPFGWWAMEPEALVQLMSEIQLEQPQVIVECGSGLSTLLIGDLLKQSGTGHLYSIEEDEDWYRVVSGLIAGQDLGAHVTLIHAPLESYMVKEDCEIEWYSRDNLEHALSQVNKIDMLIVDGPKTTKVLSRFPALPYFLPLLNSKALVVLDDVNRSQEQSVISEWCKLSSLSVDIHTRSDRHQAYIRVGP